MGEAEWYVSKRFIIDYLEIIQRRLFYQEYISNIIEYFEIWPQDIKVKGGCQELSSSLPLWSISYQ